MLPSAEVFWFDAGPTQTLSPSGSSTVYSTNFPSLLYSPTAYLDRHAASLSGFSSAQYDPAGFDPSSITRTILVPCGRVMGLASMKFTACSAGSVAHPGELRSSGGSRGPGDPGTVPK